MMKQHIFNQHLIQRGLTRFTLTLFMIYVQEHILMPLFNQLARKMNIRPCAIWSIATPVNTRLFLLPTGDMKTITSLHTSMKTISSILSVLRTCTVTELFLLQSHCSPKTRKILMKISQLPWQESKPRKWRQTLKNIE